MYRVNFYNNADKERLLCWYKAKSRNEAEGLVKHSKFWYTEVVRYA